MKIGIIPWFFAVSLVAGCQDKTIGTVEGKVYLDGELLEKGEIHFYPEDRQGRTAGGFIQNGSFQVKMVAVGKSIVRITSPKVVGKEKAYDAPDAVEYDVLREMIPPEYNAKSKLREDVQPGINEVVYKLQSKK